ncbi:AT-RICH INTERACTIVE DOMAIN-CONTAINING PROTEIN 2 [Salix purpurea]|uniref:AT-RICH INTERACTIVE DOMAIN-CONTAINING PROTEIN 2 n=1 Tax=Salix purpurea TaxID=77065 RepID=A0A9Q0T933_SALPP|nr:AT-RICH INTERACTIVE DOMAIN-CONTAINING PROTEIN 2 [Salix purpurea]
MAWLILTNGSALDCPDDVIYRYRGTGGCPDISMKDEIKECIVVDSDEDGYDYDCEDRVICLFDEVVSIFLNEAADGGCIRPIPALLGDGQSLDLFKLYWVVRKRGGFDLVNGFWNFVAKELGLDLQFSPSVKLIYMKYLYELEKFMKICSDEKLRKELHQCDGNLSFSLLELEMQFRSLLSLIGDRKQGDGKFASLGYKVNGRYIETAIGKRKEVFLDTKDEHQIPNYAGNRNGDDDDEKSQGEKKNYSNGSDDDVVILDPSIAKKEFNSRKRKQEPLTRMLNWVIQIAKCPDDPFIGVIHRGDELWSQAIRAREALFQRQHVNPNIEQSSAQVCNMNLQSNQKMCPSMFEDVSFPSEQSAERSRCSKRPPAPEKPQLCYCCNSCSAHQSKSASLLKTKCENACKEQEHALKVQELAIGDLSSKHTTLSGSEDKHVRRHVAVGPLFQAEVPEWTGMVSESASKWLGTRFWPSKYENHNVPVAMDPIGKGGISLCGCQLPGSVGCARFHTAEKRMKLKLELGPLFYHWRFDHMGEEVSLRWTTEEEMRFKDVVRLNPLSAGKCFWDNKSKYFPRKTREELISYYFNAYLVRCRSYQNRVTPKYTDSDDDDETKFGSLSDAYGHEALTVPGATMLICSENKQCTDFT